MKLIAKPFSALTADEIYEILRARCEVFNIEQNIHYLDPDGVDKRALHCFFWEGCKVSAYLRAYIDNTSVLATDNANNNDEHADTAVKIGRVFTRVRGKGVGRALMEQSLAAIKAWQPKCNLIIMDAQRHAEGFYKKLGFDTVLDVFLEEGVEHIKMQKAV